MRPLRQKLGEGSGLPARAVKTAAFGREQLR